MTSMLKNLKVVELASILAGPAVGTFFAELGAQVLKVENKKTAGDITRSWKVAGENPVAAVSAYYASANWGKEVIFADLSNPTEREEIYGHIAEADIVIANFKAGADKKLGMDYDTIRKLNPSIIYAHITGYGENNPRPAFDALLQAETGYMSMNGTADSGPLKMPVAMIDILAAHQLKEGILLALLHRSQSEEGAYVGISLYDAAIASLANQSSNWLMAGHLPERMGSLHPNIAPYGEVFTTKDGSEVMLAVGTDEQFNTLVDILGEPSLSADPKLTSNSERVSHRAYLGERLQPLFERFNANSLLTSLQENKVPATLIQNLQEVFANPASQKLILEEDMHGIATKRVKTAVFKLQFNAKITA